MAMFLFRKALQCRAYSCPPNSRGVVNCLAGVRDEVVCAKELGAQHARLCVGGGEIHVRLPVHLQGLVEPDALNLEHFGSLGTGWGTWDTEADGLQEEHSLVCEWWKCGDHGQHL